MHRHRLSFRPHSALHSAIQGVITIITPLVFFSFLFSYSVLVCLSAWIAVRYNHLVFPSLGLTRDSPLLTSLLPLVFLSAVVFRSHSFSISLRS
ncbi:hypothetical protein EDB83DRAFT_2374809 [Lactarius deliciosus]|nr:hypothetical protein EDB83DRAFT_2374809 [Lactarius deliciosus]